MASGYWAVVNCWEGGRGRTLPSSCVQSSTAISCSSPSATSTFRTTSETLPDDPNATRHTTAHGLLAPSRRYSNSVAGLCFVVRGSVVDSGRASASESVEPSGRSRAGIALYSLRVLSVCSALCRAAFLKGHHAYIIERSETHGPWFRGCPQPPAATTSTRGYGTLHAPVENRLTLRAPRQRNLYTPRHGKTSFSSLAKSACLPCSHEPERRADHSPSVCPQHAGSIL